jgi:drug/metabolite transporter (DMT)-like permease
MTARRGGIGRPLQRLALGVITILIWSACFVVIKASQGSAPPLLFAALRALVAGVPLLVVAASAGKVRPPAGHWAWLGALGMTNTTLGLAGMFLSVSVVGAAVPGVLANSQALLVAPFAALFFGEVLSRGRVLGLVVGVIGVALVLSGDGQGPVTVTGVAFSLMAAAGIAGRNLVMKHIGRRVDALTATAWQYVLGGLALLGWALLVEDPARLAWTRAFVAGLLFLGLAGSAGTSWLWYHLVRDGELIALNGLTLLIPAFALGLALLIYREHLSVPSLAGVAATAAGVMWVSWPRRAAIEAPGQSAAAR